MSEKNQKFRRDIFGMDAEKTSDSAFNQQRAKLRPEALEAVFHKYTVGLNNFHAYKSQRIGCFALKVDKVIKIIGK